MSTDTDTRCAFVRRGTVHMHSEDVFAELREYNGVREISDAAAVSIASWYQSPTGPGRHFAALVGFFPVHVSDLHDAIADARTYISPDLQLAERELDHLALDMLATWALNGPGLEHAGYPHEPGTLYDCPACEASGELDAD